MPEIKRFNLLQFEPYLTFLSTDEFVSSILVKRLDDSKAKKDLEEAILAKVKESYRGENEDYIETVLKLSLESVRAQNIKEWYVEFGKRAFEHIANLLIKTSKIRNYELYKFVGLYIEPLQICLAYIVNNKLHINLDSFSEENFYNLSLLGNHGISDLHIHAETSYLFRELLEFFIRNPNLLLEEISNPKNRKKKGELVKLIRDSQTIAYVDYFLNCSHPSTDFLNAILSSKIGFLAPRHPYFRSFKYTEFVYRALVNLFHSEEIEKAFYGLIALQKVNSIMRSVTFKGEYKGLKHMSKFFDNLLKRIYQRRRRNDTTLLKIEPIKSKKVNYAEIRISPEETQLKYWANWAKDKGNIKIIVHYKKFKTWNELLDFFVKEENQIEFLHKKTRGFFKGLRRELHRQQERQKGYYRENIVGFDAASIEYWTPPWVYRDIFKFWELVYRNLFGKEIFFTFHAGEDFIDTATGLRYVYEAIRFLNVRRIGHGMALFVNFRRYHLRYTYINLPVLHYFFHLLWLNHMVNLHIGQLSDLLPFVKTAIEEFKELVVGRDEKNKEKFNSDALYRMYEDLGFSEPLYKRAFVIKNLFHVFLRNAIEENYTNLNTAKEVYTFIRKIAKRIKENSYLRTYSFTIAPLLPLSLMPDVERQIDFLERIADIVTELVKKKSVMVEVCPSSNVILYNIRSFRDHPALSKAEDFKICINTDNPLLLNTNPILEHLIFKEVFRDDNKFKEILEDCQNFHFDMGYNL